MTKALTLEQKIANRFGIREAEPKDAVVDCQIRFLLGSQVYMFDIGGLAGDDLISMAPKTGSIKDFLLHGAKGEKKNFARTQQTIELQVTIVIPARKENDPGREERLQKINEEMDRQAKKEAQKEKKHWQKKTKTRSGLTIYEDSRSIEEIMAEGSQNKDGPAGRPSKVSFDALPENIRESLSGKIGSQSELKRAYKKGPSATGGKAD